MNNQIKLGSWISEEQWNEIKAHFPAHLLTRVTKKDAEYRLFINTVLWVVQNNATWPNILYPKGSWRSVYVRYLRWVELGRWECVARGLGGVQGQSLSAYVERTHARLQWRMDRQQGRMIENGNL